MNRVVLVTVLLVALLTVSAPAEARAAGDVQRGHACAATAVAFKPSDCLIAIKILTQYERLAKKFGLKLSPNRIKELNRKRDRGGTISTNDLPATLRRNFPGYFRGKSLRDIARQCFAAYGIGERWTGYA